MRALALILLALSSLTACGSKVVVNSQTLVTRLEPEVRLAVYAPHDEQTANIYLTDLSRDEIDGDIPIQDATGVLIHIHLFLNPQPGRTPLDHSAVSATVRLFVLAAGEVGVYGGGGFIRPRGRPGDYSIAAELDHATLAPTDATPLFADLLGPSVMKARFTALRDPPRATRIADIMAEILRRARDE
ncbi:MAG: hypothetical protein AAGK04_04115 [Planctomycetota bacterium]